MIGLTPWITCCDAALGIAADSGLTLDTRTSAMPEDHLRLEALTLARRALPDCAPVDQVMRHANAYLDFLKGSDRAALAEEAKAAIDRAVK